MTWHRQIFFLTVCALWCVSLLVRPVRAQVRADDEAPAVTFDLKAALTQALAENLDLKAKREALGVAHGRVQQAALFFQENPRLSVDVDYRHRRFTVPTGRSTADVEVRVLQEIEIAGQRGHRREAAAKNLAQAEWSIADAERLLRLAVTHAFYELLALQEQIATQQQVLSTQETLLHAGLGRFEREDITILELDTLRLAQDQTRSDLVSREEEKVFKEKYLRSLLGLQEERALVTAGHLPTLAVEQGERHKALLREDLEVCAFDNRPDLKAARLSLEEREAELRLAQADRIPNLALGPLYKLDNEDQVIGGAITIPLPLFNRNQQEITAALAHLEVARTELKARRLTIKQEMASAHTRVRLFEHRLTSYGGTYLDNLSHSAALTQKAYEAGELTIFEFGVAFDRLVQARFRYLDTTLAYLKAMADLDAQSSFSCSDKSPLAPLS